MHGVHTMCWECQVEKATTEMMTGVFYMMGYKPCTTDRVGVTAVLILLSLSKVSLAVVIRVRGRRSWFAPTVVRVNT